MGLRRKARSLRPCFLLSLCVFWAGPLRGQIESIPSGSRHFHWASHGRAEGHLTLRFSSAGSFAPDSSSLAVVSRGDVLLMDLRGGAVRKVLHPRVQGVRDFEIRSAQFLTPGRLFVLGSGFFHIKDNDLPPSTPPLVFQWDPNQDALASKVNQLERGENPSVPFYFPYSRSLCFFKEGNFILWDLMEGKLGGFGVSGLTRRPNLYQFSPDFRWLLLAQIETSSTADPTVVDLRQRRMVDTLRGHQGTVLGMAFSRDGKKAVTACEDGKVRIWSTVDWKLLETLSGHEGPVHWAEFSSDGYWVATASEDTTVKIWSVEDGTLEQTLREGGAPVFTVAFSPSDEYLAASTEATVIVWQRRSAGP